MNRPTRWSLIDAVRAGEEGAQRDFVARYRPAVQRYLERRGLGVEAEDLAQEVFVRLLVKGALERVAREKGSFRSFLFALARNVLGHHLAKRGARKRGGDVEVVSLASEPESEQERAAFDREWLIYLIELAMGRLQRSHENYFLALRGFLFQQLPQAELAAQLGVREQDVRNHVHRGKKKLIAYLREEVARYEHEPARHETEVELLSRLLDGAR